MVTLLLKIEEIAQRWQLKPMLRQWNWYLSYPRGLCIQQIYILWYIWRSIFNIIKRKKDHSITSNSSLNTHSILRSSFDFPQSNDNQSILKVIRNEFHFALMDPSSVHDRRFVSSNNYHTPQVQHFSCPFFSLSTLIKMAINYIIFNRLFFTPKKRERERWKRKERNEGKYSERLNWVWSFCTLFALRTGRSTRIFVVQHATCEKYTHTHMHTHKHWQRGGHTQFKCWVCNFIFPA